MSVKYWPRIIHPAIAAIAPSKEKIIATDAGLKFCWPNIWSKKAKPLDKIPTYKISLYSNKIFENFITSRVVAGIKVKIDPIKHCDAAMVIGKLKNFNNLEIKTIWKDQKSALNKAILSPSLTVTLLNSVNNNPPKKQIKTDGHMDQWIFFEKKKYETKGTKTTYNTVNTAVLATLVYSSAYCWRALPYATKNPINNK